MDWYTQLFLPHACLGPATLDKTARHNPLSDSIFVFLLAATIIDMLCLSFMALLVPLPLPHHLHTCTGCQGRDSCPFPHCCMPSA